MCHADGEVEDHVITVVEAWKEGEVGDMAEKRPRARKRPCDTNSGRGGRRVICEGVTLHGVEVEHP